MAQRLVTSFVNTNIPGAYVETTVKSTPVGVTSTGDIVIIGEADGGAHFSAESLKDNFFDSTQLDRVKAKYLRGPIIDAMSALTNPSNDSEITGSTGRVYIAKTNSGSKAQATVAGDSADYGTFTDKNFGVDGNKYYYEILQSESESAPEVTSSDLDFADPTIYDGLEFDVRVNGGAEATVTLGVGTHGDLATLAAEIDGLLPAGLNCEVAGAGIKIVADADADANEKGWGKSFELIDSTPGDLATLGVSAGLQVSSQEPEIQVSILRQDTNTNEIFTIAAEVAITVGYQGDTATLTVNNGVLTTAVTGGSGANLSINLSEYPTMADLAAFIDSQAGYSATVVAASTNLAPIRLDEVSAISIASTGDVEAGRVKRAAWNFADAISQSSVLDFDFLLSQGLPADFNGKKYLAGGTKGSTSGANIVDAITALEGIKVNFVLPLFSRDASEDIADGLTDSGSTYTIDAINFAVKNHVLAMSRIKIKRNRVAMLSKWGSFADIKTHSQTLSSFRCNLTFQKSSQVDELGNIVEYFPWHTAAIATGMQSAGFYKSITNKFANVVSFKDPSGFDSGNIGSVEEAIDAGLLFLQQENAGNSWVVDQTTYGFDTNFVYNSLQAVYMSDVLSVQLAEALQRFAVGKSLADINAPAILGQISKLMEEYRRLKIIGASDDAPLGYKNPAVRINGPIAEVKLEAKLATALLFIPIQLELSQIQSSANA